MKKIIITGFILLFVLSGDTLMAYTRPDVTEVFKSHTESEYYKAIESKLGAALISEHNSEAVSKIMKKIWDASRNLSPKEKKELLIRLANRSSETLKNIIKLSKNGLEDYVRTVASNITINKKTLEQIVGGSGDAAGESALKALSSLDTLPKTDKLLKATLKLFKKEASGLQDPKRVRAYLELIRDRFKDDYTKISTNSKSMGKFLGTCVDGVFVFNDAMNIYYLDDPEEKGIQATGKIVEYISYTGATVASGMAQGATTTIIGGFLPGLAISLSAVQIGTLVTEIIKLKNDRENAKSAEESSTLGLWIMAREQLVNINGLIKSGDLNKARIILSKTRHYLQKHDNLWKDKILFHLYFEMDEKLDKADRINSINLIINEARFSYFKALNLYRKKCNLSEALIYAKESFNILKNNINMYPELKTSKAYEYVNSLLEAINKEIANASPVIITNIRGPQKVIAGEYVDFTLSVKGGIPYYQPVGMSGFGTMSETIIYWEAPSKLGKTKVHFKISDSIKQITTGETIVEVIPIPKENIKNDVKLIAYTTVFDLNGKMEINNNLGIKTNKGFNVEAHDVYPSDNVNFIVNLDNPNYKYVWKVNGVEKKNSNWKRTFYLRTAKEAYEPYGIIGIGRTTVTIEIYDEENKFIGKDSWVVTVKNFKNIQYKDDSGIIPPGDD